MKLVVGAYDSVLHPVSTVIVFGVAVPLVIAIGWCVRPIYCMASTVVCPRALTTTPPGFSRSRTPRPESGPAGGDILRKDRTHWVQQPLTLRGSIRMDPLHTHRAPSAHPPGSLCTPTGLPTLTFTLPRERHAPT